MQSKSKKIFIYQDCRKIYLLCCKIIGYIKNDCLELIFEFTPKSHKTPKLSETISYVCKKKIH